MVMECWVTVFFTAAVNSLTLSFASGSISNASFLLSDSRSLWVLYLCIIWMKPCWSCTEITVWKIYILIFCCYCFKIIFFVRLTLFFCEAGYTEILFLIWAKWIFLWVQLDRQKKCVFLCVYFIFLCGLTHRKISFNLGEHNFSVRVRPTEKLFLTVNPQKNSIFLSLYFCGYFSEGTPIEKYFSDGIRIFLCVFAHTEKSEIPVVGDICFFHAIQNCSTWINFCSNFKILVKPQATNFCLESMMICSRYTNICFTWTNFMLI